MGNSLAPEVVPDDFAEMFWGMIERSIDEEGMRIGHGIARHKDGQHTMLALALDNPLEAYGHVIGLILKSDLPRAKFGPVEDLIFGWDRYTKRGQGNRYGDCISVHRYRPTLGLTLPIYEASWTFGVLDYQSPSAFREKIAEPINWDNVAWREMLRGEFHKCMTTITAQAISARINEQKASK